MVIVDEEGEKSQAKSQIEEKLKQYATNILKLSDPAVSCYLSDSDQVGHICIRFKCHFFIADNLFSEIKDKIQAVLLPIIKEFSDLLIFTHRQLPLKMCSLKIMLAQMPYQQLTKELIDLLNNELEKKPSPQVTPVAELTLSIMDLSL